MWYVTDIYDIWPTPTKPIIWVKINFSCLFVDTVKAKIMSCKIMYTSNVAFAQNFANEFFLKNTFFLFSTDLRYDYCHLSPKQFSQLATGFVVMGHI